MNDVKPELLALGIEQVLVFVNESAEDLKRFEVVGNINEILLIKDVVVSDLKIVQGNL